MPRQEITKMKRILLDTNFFMVPFQLHINIFSELERVVDEQFELFTLTPLKGELETIARSGKGKDKSAAQLATQIARGVKSVETDKKGDAAILDYAKTNKDVIVATNDSDLRKRLKAAGVRTIFVRGRNKLEME